MWRCLFLIPLQPSSPSIMRPSSRVHPPACLIWTFRRVSFACGPRPCLYFQCCNLSDMYTNKRFVQSFTLPPLRVASHLSFDIPFGSCPNTSWRGPLMLRDQVCVMQGDKDLVCFYDRNDPGVCGDRREYIVRSKTKRTLNTLYIWSADAMITGSKFWIHLRYHTCTHSFSLDFISRYRDRLKED